MKFTHFCKNHNNEWNIYFRVRVALTEDGVPMSTLREIALLKQLDAFKHPNIVKLVLFMEFNLFSTGYWHCVVYLLSLGY